MNEEVEPNGVSKKTGRDKIKPQKRDEESLMLKNEERRKWQLGKTVAEMQTVRELKWEYSGNDIEGKRIRIWRIIAGESLLACYLGSV